MRDEKLLNEMRRLRENMCEVADVMAKHDDSNVTEHAKELFGAAAMMGTWILGVESLTVNKENG